VRILLAEDKVRMAEVLQRALQREGHTVNLAFDGEEAFTLASYEKLDVMVLDVMLPRMDGFTVIKSLRASKCTIPTIMLTTRDAMADIIRGLDAGADDYLTKPFALEILLARIRALGRRVPVSYESSLRFADLVLDTGAREVKRGARSEPLTRTEFALLELLIRRAGRVVPRDTLIEAGWGLDAEVSESTLYVFIRNLRDKIQQPGERPFLHTARGVGYVLRAQPE
jgi:DNA-binding response OmpR family regulator